MIRIVPSKVISASGNDDGLGWQAKRTALKGHLWLGPQPFTNDSHIPLRNKIMSCSTSILSYSDALPMSFFPLEPLHVDSTTRHLGA
jgi:hypothetical protein